MHPARSGDPGGDGRGGRDRGIDALRALAIGGVVLGHWLVTAWERVPRLVISSPLAYQPHLVAASWVLQTLSVFFLVGGYVAARPRTTASTRTGNRLVHLVRPTAPLLAVWALVAGVLALNGVPYREIRALALPALGPLWFLAVFGALAALTPVLKRLPLRLTIISLILLVAVVDTARFALGAPAWIGSLNLSAWAVPYLLGMLWARNGLTRRHGIWLLTGGAAATIVLVTWFGYPAAMVGVTGVKVSNLNPPTLAALTFGLAQTGLALLLHRPLSRVTSSIVTTVNKHAMPIFLWHQTVLATAVTVFSLYGRPDSPAWIAQRLTLIAAILVFMTWCRHQLDGRPARL
ncbi:acyltransferase [Nonomuraea sp. NPDC050556]|uniref:acyltransferase n=1 Tax=Nonomuraea sp. NPDC050556 TaxID=3364369 RepID=UPI0037B1B8C9